MVSNELQAALDAAAAAAEISRAHSRDIVKLPRDFYFTMRGLASAA
jgi:hypothetical protein